MPSMQEKLLYEYAVIRIVPRVERGEFLNAGVIFYCRDAGYLNLKYEVNSQKILMMDSKTDIDEIRSVLRGFEKVCCGNENSGLIGSLVPAERFRWLTAKRSAVVQVSQVHPGFCDDPAVELEKLYQNLVEN